MSVEELKCRVELISGKTGEIANKINLKLNEGWKLYGNPYCANSNGDHVTPNIIHYQLMIFYYSEY